MSDGLQRDGPHVREPVDGRVRAALGRAGISFAVVHGSGHERLSNAWTALNLATQAEAPASDPSTRSDPPTGWRGACDKCSDPVCEHRLFTDLLGQRASKG